MNLKVRGTKYLPAAGRRSTGLLAESIHVAKRIDIFPPLPSSHCFRHWRACRMSYFVFPTLYFVLGTLYFLMPNAQCRMLKWEILAMEQFRTSYLVFPTLYFVHGTLYFLMPNAQCRMVKWEILPMEQFRTSPACRRQVSRISYFVLGTLYFVHGTLYYIPPTFVLILRG